MNTDFMSSTVKRSYYIGYSSKMRRFLNGYLRMVRLVDGGGTLLV